MADSITLSAQPRTVTGKQVAQLRRAGITPIVVYGRRTEPLALQVSTRELVDVLGRSGSSRLVTLKVDGEKRPRMTLVRDVQRHTTTFAVTHADLLQVAMDVAVRSEVHLELVGEPHLVQKHEAIIEHDLKTVTVEALPADLPSSVVVDCATLQHFGDTICIADLVAEGARFQLLHDPDTIVARLLPLGRGGEATEAEGEGEAEAAEPEVISERRRTDEA